MDHLSSMDAVFLHFETPETPMHVGSVELLDLPKGYKGDFYDDARAYLTARLHLVPAFRRKLVLMPFDLANPLWADDDEMDIDHHIRHVILPRPGSFETLEKLVGRLHSPLMDRSRPLWEIYIIEGLKSGQVALYTKMHHCGIDGQAGVALAKVLFSPSPEPEPVKPPPARSRANRGQLGVAELVGVGVRIAAKQTTSIFKTLPQTRKALLDLIAPVSAADGKRHFGLPKGMSRAPTTPFNVSISNQRAFAARSVPLADIKLMSKATGSSVNDVVMAICAGALKSYLDDYKIKLDKPLIAAIPVSLREAGNTDSNNQVSMMRVSLATDVDDPLQRLAAIHESAQQGKQQLGTLRALPTDFPSFGSPWMLSGLASLAGRTNLAARLPAMMNVVISNVPGPQFPLYFAGAKLVTYYPVSIPAHGGALNMTVQSYNGSLDFGLTACRRAVPDVADLADHVLAEHHKLLAVVTQRARAQTAGRESAPAKARLAPAGKASKATVTRVSKATKATKAGTAAKTVSGGGRATTARKVGAAAAGKKAARPARAGAAR